MYIDISIPKLKRIVQKIRICESHFMHQLKEIEDTRQNLQKIEEEGIQIVVKKLQKMEENLQENIYQVKILYLILQKILIVYERNEVLLSSDGQNVLMIPLAYIGRKDLTGLGKKLEEFHIMFEK